jgi:hypothetical protein
MHARAQQRAAHQRPMQEVDCVYRKDESWCGTTSPPMFGCLKMYID